MRQDYFLYPGMDYSMGFTSRGCPRHCYFCVVPKKEGAYQRWQHPSVWHDPKFSKAKLLDNNWYADRDWFMETSQWFIDHKIAVDVTQGMDIRLLTDEIASQLKRLKWSAPVHFAFDDEKYAQAVEDGIGILKKAGFNLHSSGSIYVYCHDNAHYESALERCRLLKEWGATAFLMWNCDNKDKSREVKDLQWIVNRRLAYWTKGSLDTPKRVSA